MKYLEILKQKDLSVEKLPKVLQKKIQELNFQYNELKKFESDEELDEEELEDIVIVKQKIDELDSHIAHKVKIFDQAKYDDKLAKISKMREARGVKEEKVIEPIAKVVSINQEQKVQQEPQVQVQPKLTKEPIAYEEEEQEEFEKVGEGKPKKMTTGLILMGVGAFFLTWGAVNFFKSRK